MYILTCNHAVSQFNILIILIQVTSDTVVHFDTTLYPMTS